MYRDERGPERKSELQAVCCLDSSSADPLWISVALLVAVGDWQHSAAGVEVESLRAVELLAVVVSPELATPEFEVVGSVLCCWPGSSKLASPEHKTVVL